VHALHFISQSLQHPDAFSVVLLLGIGLVALAGAYLVSLVDVTVLAVVALLLEMFSGNWGLTGLAVPFDRLALAIALGALLLKGARNVGARRLVLRPLHLVLLSALAWCAVSGLIAGTITGSVGFYAFLDRFGVFPFLWFCIAPILFGTTRQRKILLVGLVAMGLYLGFTGLMEGLHVYKFLFPRYIANPNVGIQWGRARGPFLESTGDGFCAFVGGSAAYIGLRTWRSSSARWICLLTIGLDLATNFFTLTRGVWIGTFLGVGAIMVLTKELRRFIAPCLLAGVILVVGTLVISPTIRAEAIGRATQQSPVWDRQNTDLAALRIIEEKPLTGVGWENFVNVGSNYMIQQPGYPITGIGLEIHNVFLSHAAEVGLPGFLLWFTGLLGAIRWAFLPRGLMRRGKTDKSPPSLEIQLWRADPELQLWRTAGMAVLLCFFVIANLAPVSEALPNALLWIWLGILATPYTSVLRTQVLRRGTVRGVQVLSTGPATNTPDLRPVYL
jgi:putative inorganic carbon (HCO3(-)) transporter